MILYLHGFNSSPASRKARELGAHLAARGLGAQFACPALPHHPADAIATIEAEMRRHAGEPITFLGSSLGGFYATHLAEKHALRAVLVNPAVYPERDLARYLGGQQNLYTGDRYELTPRHLRELESLVVARVTPERYLLLVETGDEVLDYREAVARYAGARQVVIDGGDHTLRSFRDHFPLIGEFAGIAGL